MLTSTADLKVDDLVEFTEQYWLVVAQHRGLCTLVNQQGQKAHFGKGGGYPVNRVRHASKLDKLIIFNKGPRE